MNDEPRGGNSECPPWRYGVLLATITACAPAPARPAVSSSAPLGHPEESAVAVSPATLGNTAAPLDLSGDAELFATPLAPVALEGPYPTLVAACEGAQPCGHTRIDPSTFEAVDPPATPDCSAVDDPAFLHTSGDHVLRFGLIKCAIPPNLPWSEGRYHAFVRTGTSWWRSPPLLSYDLGRFTTPAVHGPPVVRASGTVRWEDRTGHTLGRFTATVTAPACTQTPQRATNFATVDALVRFDTSGAAARVYPAIPIATRSERKVENPSMACSPEQRADAPAEVWLSRDVLELGEAYPGRALTRPVNFGIFEVIASGRYHFVHGPPDEQLRTPP